MSRPILLGLFSGLGGADMGYHRAGSDVIGVDIEPQPYYPFEFHQADAMEVLALLATGAEPWPGAPEFDGIVASPPCQFKTQMAASHRSRGFDDRPDLLTPTRSRLREIGKPYVIENVNGAKGSMATTLTLHGGMFGLGVHRPRRFESSELLLGFEAPMCAEPIGVYGTRPAKNWSTRLNGNMKGKRSVFRVARSLAEGQEAMGIDWGDWHGLTEAIPPAYTEYIGLQFIEAIQAGKAA